MFVLFCATFASDVRFLIFFETNVSSRVMYNCKVLIENSKYLLDIRALKDNRIGNTYMNRF